MSYIAKRLAPNEVIEVEGRFHWSQYLYAWAALLVLGVLVIGIVIWIREMVRLNTTEFVVTSRRVILKQGWLAVKSDELTLSSIEGSHIDQSIPGRLFGYGRLTIRGRGDTHLLFPTMAQPARFRAAAEAARMAEEARPVEVVPADAAPPPPADPHRLTHAERKAAKKAAKAERKAAEAERRAARHHRPAHS
ncbi:MAG: PH domain-containing protein [Alphaproteobacteria bacterium]